ncbi:MAG TPA: hypothetical protein VKF17_09175, partial [Isosphaeraceae bacterium]|nr:hypothetical protein [Isosphaeraceae bacterium]
TATSFRPARASLENRSRSTVPASFSPDRSGVFLGVLEHLDPRTINGLAAVGHHVQMDVGGELDWSSTPSL